MTKKTVEQITSYVDLKQCIEHGCYTMGVILIARSLAPVSWISSKPEHQQAKQQLINS
jgi:hypothetical protein